MNNDRRKSITKLIATAEALKVLAEDLAGKLDDLANEIETVKDEEEEYRNNMPENLHDSERYYDSEAAVDALTEAHTSIETIRDEAQALDFDDLVSKLDEAKA